MARSPSEFEGNMIWCLKCISDGLTTVELPTDEQVVAQCRRGLLNHRRSILLSAARDLRRRGRTAANHGQAKYTRVFIQAILEIAVLPDSAYTTVGLASLLGSTARIASQSLAEAFSDTPAEYLRTLVEGDETTCSVTTDEAIFLIKTARRELFMWTGRLANYSS